MGVLRVTRAERAAEAARLKAEGLNGVQIAERMGLSRTYAYALLSDPDGSGDKARKQSYGRDCIDCGARTNGSDGRANAPERCDTCHHARKHEEATARHLHAAREWVRRYGSPPTATDWNPAHARAIGRPDKAERFERDGCWPWAYAAMRLFGSWSAFLAAAGYPEPRIRYPGDDPAVVAETVRLYVDEGLSGFQIAAMKGINPNTVYRRLKGAGVERRPGTQEAPPHVRRRAAQLYAEGQSSTAVAAVLGVSHTSVLRYAREAGVAIRRGGRTARAAA